MQWKSKTLRRHIARIDKIEKSSTGKFYQRIRPLEPTLENLYRMYNDSHTGSELERTKKQYALNRYVLIHLTSSRAERRLVETAKNASDICGHEELAITMLKARTKTSGAKARALLLAEIDSAINGILQKSKSFLNVAETRQALAEHDFSAKVVRHGIAPIIGLGFIGPLKELRNAIEKAK